MTYIALINIVITLLKRFFISGSELKWVQAGYCIRTSFIIIHILSEPNFSLYVLISFIKKSKIIALAIKFTPFLMAHFDARGW